MSPTLYGYGRSWVPEFVYYVESNREPRAEMLCAEYRWVSLEGAHDILSEQRDKVAHHPNPIDPYALFEDSIRYAGLKHCSREGRRKREIEPLLQRLCSLRELLAESIEKQCERLEMIVKIRQVLASLPAKDRPVAALLLEGLTPQEIAEALPMPTSAVYESIRRIKKFLRDNLMI